MKSRLATYVNDRTNPRLQSCLWLALIVQLGLASVLLKSDAIAGNQSAPKTLKAQKSNSNRSTIIPVGEVAIPLSWWVKWYSWLSSNSLIVNYWDSRSRLDETAIYGINDKSTQAIHLPYTVKQSISHYGGSVWQVSPDKTWIMGVADSQHRVVYDVTGTKKLELPLYGFDSRWMPNSRGWVEWKWQNDTTNIWQTTLTKRMDLNSSKVTKMQLEGHWVVIGAFLDRKLLLAKIGSPSNGESAAKLWNTSNKTRIPIQFLREVSGFRGILDATVSRDSKYVSWLVESDNQERDSNPSVITSQLTKIPPYKLFASI